MANEQDIASDESAVLELETELDEGSGQELEKKSDESAAAKGDGDEAGCPIWMGLNDAFPRCGRELHTVPDGVDEKRVCLMHSKDPNKQLGPLSDAFWLEF